MDRQVIEQKIEALHRCVDRIKRKTPATAELLTNDPDAQDILTLNLTRAVRPCVDIGAHPIAPQDTPALDTMWQSFEELADTGIIPTDLAVRMEKGHRFSQHRRAQLRSHRLANRPCHRHAPLDDFAAYAAAVVRAMGIRDSSA